MKKSVLNLIVSLLLIVATAATTAVITTHLSKKVEVEKDETHTRYVVDLSQYNGIFDDVRIMFVGAEDPSRNSNAFMGGGMNNGGGTAQICKEILRNPIYGDATARKFTEIKFFSDGTTLADINPWINDFLEKSAGADGLGVWLKYDNSKQPYLTGEYLQYAYGLIVLINQTTI